VMNVKLLDTIPYGMLWWM